MYKKKLEKGKIIHKKYIDTFYTLSRLLLNIVGSIDIKEESGSNI